jgi:fructose-1,6-bisphosphatase I
MNLQQFLGKEAPKSLAPLIMAVASSSVMVLDNLPRGSGLAGGVNPSGENQKAIDVLSNEVFTRALLDTGAAAEIASEETAEPVKGKGSVSVAMDPLDGSSNVATNNPVGSIFGFYSKRLPCSGRNLAGAAYITYGGMLTLTLSFGRGVHRFVITRNGDEFECEHLDSGLMIPEKPAVYGVGGGRREWIPGVLEFVESLEGRSLSLRYCGTFVGDYNQVLARGGIFSYPALVKKPKGKLRVLYESAPMAFINEQAGGYASDGAGNVLDIEPVGLADTSPLYIGSASLVRELERRISSKA